MTEDEARAMLKQLQEHYKEPVKPVSQYCKAFELWAQAIQDEVKRNEEYLKTRDEETDKWPYRSPFKKLASMFSYGHDMDGQIDLQLAIKKSSLLARLVYGNETELRTEMCPQHKGQWSGIGGGGADAWMGGCTYGCDLYGWIPNEIKTEEDRIEFFKKRAQEHIDWRCKDIKNRPWVYSDSWMKEEAASLNKIIPTAIEQYEYAKSYGLKHAETKTKEEWLERRMARKS